MDALSDVLRIMRLKGGLFLRGEFRAPWCVAVQPRPAHCAPYLGDTTHIIPYHFVLEGRLRVAVEDLPDSEVELEPGEAIMFPRNDRHLMGSDLSLPPANGLEVIERPDEGSLLTMFLGDDGPVTRIVCGFLGAESVRGNPVVNALPAAIRLDMRDGAAGDWIRASFHHAAEHIAAGRLGSEVTMSRLSELLFVEGVQRYADALPEGEKSWLAGLKDPYVSRALAVLHARPREDWTVEALGRQVGLSRSSLAERFVSMLGVPPMQYLASWRIHLAAHELVHTSKSIAQVADEVGYESEASFTRAFKRVMERPPAAWRRERISA